jgi:hypothetical protein
MRPVSATMHMSAKAVVITLVSAGVYACTKPMGRPMSDEELCLDDNSVDLLRALDGCMRAVNAPAPEVDDADRIRARIAEIVSKLSPDSGAEAGAAMAWPRTR